LVLILILASNMSDHRKSASYPIQSSEYTPHPHQPPPTLEEDTKGPIPASIRAVKDAHHANNEGRTVVICLDGTGDRFDNDNSNVVHFVSCLKKHEPAKQVTYYQSGIGTYDSGGLRNGFGAAMVGIFGTKVIRESKQANYYLRCTGHGCGKVSSVAIDFRSISYQSSGLGVHIKDAYRFLMQNYHEGDRICLFGFSRGAYTVRCLAGMLHKVGLLPASNGSQVSDTKNVVFSKRLLSIWLHLSLSAF
jgi:uncharacterized protein (DUF2235 family)